MAGLESAVPSGIALSGTVPSDNGSADLALTRSLVERAAERRSDSRWLADAWADPRTRVIVVHDGRALARISDQAAELIFLTPDRAPKGVRFLLGVDAEDVAYFGVAAPLTGIGGAGGIRLAGLREVGMLLTDLDAELLAHAAALGNWHAAAAFCPRCGSPTEPELAGHSRRCPADRSEHFPRSDPAVIMLVTDPDDRCLLARNTDWPKRRVSVLAGFVEPGESAEQAVAREVFEEAGVVVTTVSYAGSQPWPMPHNLMLGFRARAAGTDIQIDAKEIAEARWYSRDELRSAVEAGDLLVPPSLSISRWLIESWYGARLPVTTPR